MIIKPKFRRFSFLDMSELTFNRFPKSCAKSGYVYLIYDGLKTKIGQSQNPRTRIVQVCKDVGVSDPEIWVSTNMDHCNVYEKYLHSVFQHKNISGEWFSVSPDEVMEKTNTIVVLPTGNSGSKKWSFSEISDMEADSFRGEVQDVVLSNYDVIFRLISTFSMISEDEAEDMIGKNYSASILCYDQAMEIINLFEENRFLKMIKDRAKVECVQ